jgi:hypothetical protein
MSKAIGEEGHQEEEGLISDREVFALLFIFSGEDRNDNQNYRREDRAD